MATVQRAQRFVYFPGMLKEAESVVKRCHQCQVKVGNAKPQRHTLFPHVEGYPFQKLSLDFVGPLPTSTRGNNYLLTVKDTFTRWLEAFPIRSANAAIVVRRLETEIFPRYGLCDQIHSDRGSQFTSDMLGEVASILGIRASFTPAYNPKSNPVERAHRDLESAITALVEGKQNKWEEVLPQALFAMRTAVCRSTGFAPYRILFGRDASSTLDLIFSDPNLEKKDHDSYESYAKALHYRITSAHAWARKNISGAIDRQRRAYHQDKKSFQAGDMVWLFTPRLRPGQSKKFATYWTGPWLVGRRINDLLYEIRPDPTWKRKSNEVVSIDRLKIYYPEEASKSSPPPGDDADLSMQGDEYAEHVTPDQDNEEIGSDPLPRLEQAPRPLQQQPPADQPAQQQRIVQPVQQQQREREPRDHTPEGQRREITLPPRVARAPPVQRHDSLVPAPVYKPARATKKGNEMPQARRSPRLAANTSLRQEIERGRLLQQRQTEFQRMDLQRQQRLERHENRGRQEAPIPASTAGDQPSEGGGRGAGASRELEQEFENIEILQ